MAAKKNTKKVEKVARKNILADNRDKRLVLAKAIEDAKTQADSQRTKALKAISAAGKKGLLIATFVEKNPPYLVRYLTNHGLAKIVG